MIWCVEDDERIMEMELYTLKTAGFDARGFDSAKQFFEALENSKMPELVLLDIMLPEIDGTQILRKLRKNPKTSELPIIMTTAKNQEYDKVECFEYGADDYLVKPFGMMEMVSHIKAVLRRCQQREAKDKIEIENLSMNLSAYSVKVDGKEVPLTFKEFQVLKLFIENPNVAFTRERLFSEVWGEDYMGESRTVDMHIKTLRHKLGTFGENIKTVRNVGYKLEVSP